MVNMVITAMKDDDSKVFMMKLYYDYYGLVRKTIYNITHEMDNLEDLLNDTFIKIIEKIPLIRTLESCKTAAYIVYTSRSVAINFIKHSNVQKKHTYYGTETDLAEDLPSREETIEDRIIHQEEIEEMGSAILDLPKKQKDLLYFKYILEMDNGKIAEILGIASVSIRQYLTRARRNAKQIMDKEMNRHAN